MLEKMKGKVLVQALVLAVWLALIVSAYGYLVLYAATPGQKADAPLSWPSASRLVPGEDRPTLLVFIHPKCVCSRATLAELSRIMTRSQGKVRAYILILLPETMQEDWAHTDLLESARSIKGTTTMIDRNGAESNRFHCQTSGHTLVYRADGKLTFSGGITSSRGHEGANLGRSAVEDIILHNNSSTASNQVFGCPLHER